MKAGFCHYHKYTLTLHQMRKHGCLSKNGSWCKRFEPNLNHPWWENRLKAGRSNEMAKPFIRRMERKRTEGDKNEERLQTDH